MRCWWATTNAASHESRECLLHPQLSHQRVPPSMGAAELKGCFHSDRTMVRVRYPREPSDELQLLYPDNDPPANLDSSSPTWPFAVPASNPSLLMLTLRYSASDFTCRNSRSKEHARQRSKSHLSTYAVVLQPDRRRAL